MPAEAVIVGCGLLTPVGLSARETAASTRSRTARLTSIEWRDGRFRRFTVGIVPEDGLPPLRSELEKLPLTCREHRMLRLAQPALEEALEALPPSAGPVPIFLGLPELHTRIPIANVQFLARLAQQSGAPANLPASLAFAQGRASALLALEQARDCLSAGRTAFAVVGGVDSQVDHYILGTLDMQHRVRNEVNPDGFAPGEGAGFLLLTSREQAQRRRLPILGAVLGIAKAKEEGHLDSEVPYKGEGLAAAFAALFATVPDAPKVGCVFASFNGEHYWAKEFGVAMLRNRGRFLEDHKMEHPAECFGDLGAAHGAVMLGLAALALRRACTGTCTMVYSSSDRGDRAVALLNAGK